MNDTGSRGVLLALAILLLWLAGLAFYIAFEGSKILGGKASGSEAQITQLAGGLTTLAQQVASENAGQGPATP